MRLKRRTQLARGLRFGFVAASDNHRGYPGAYGEGVVGIWAVYRLARRMFGGWILPAGAGACFALMPVVINGAHEVKPHLAGAVLVLLCALAALKYVRTGESKWWVIAGVLSGLAFGMVLTAIVAFAILGKLTDTILALGTAPLLRWEDRHGRT